MSQDSTINYRELLYDILQPPFKLGHFLGKANKSLPDEFNVEGESFKTDRSPCLYYTIFNGDMKPVAEFAQVWNIEENLNHVHNKLAKEVISELITSKLLDMSKTV